jgi:hypothetical protein
LALDYPAYMQRSPRRVEVAGVMQIPEGTSLELAAESNKPLREVAIMDRDLQSREVFPIPTGSAGNKFSHSLGALNEDRVMMFVLVDSDGIQNQQPYRLSLSMTPDEPPQVAVALSGIGSAITPTARIPLKGNITDDYGVAEAWFRSQVGEQEPRREDVAAGANGQTTWVIDLALDTAAWEGDQRLAAGERLVLEVQSSDLYDLNDEPHIGSSQRFILDVVTPEQLHAMLEGREMMLRQRFEIIYNELIDTRDLMARITFEPTGEEAAVSPGTPLTQEERDAEATRRKLRVVRAEQNVERGAFETTGVADSFDEIREEMINNRIDNEQVLRRLKDEIADPLRLIGGVSLQALEARLVQLREIVNDDELGPTAVKETITQTDEVLLEMKQVLDRMLELESYNEVVELLRAILDEQRRLNEQTQERRIERLLDPQ